MHVEPSFVTWERKQEMTSDVWLVPWMLPSSWYFLLLRTDSFIVFILNGFVINDWRKVFFQMFIIIQRALTDQSSVWNSIVLFSQ